MGLDDLFLKNNQRSTEFDSLLENTDRNSKHIVMHDKQIYHITFRITLSATRPVTQFMFYSCHRI